ncbi:MAG: O-antigen ligase domain-containing protein [Methanobacteriota archaeon]|nr:MAG: O-antigen ligase domain-containing protein [Euryarchaeota archaeon]
MASSLGRRGEHSRNVWMRPSQPVFIILMLGMVVVSDIGLLTEADGALYALLLSVLIPTLAPYLLIALCSFQGMAGLSVFWWYGGTTLLGSLLIYRILIGRMMRFKIEPLLFSAMLVVLYVAVASLLQGHLDGYPQSASRPPILVAILMMMMMGSGFSAYCQMESDPLAGQRLKWLTYVLIINGLSIAVLKILFGQNFLASEGGQAEIGVASQLVEPSAIGIPRAIGTYLTPNGFALCYSLLMLLPLLVHRERINGYYVIAFSFVTGLISLLTLSKAILIFSLLSIAILMIQTRYLKRSFMLAIAFMLALVFLFSNLLDWESLLIAFRVPVGGAADFSDSYRGEAWQAVLNNFEFPDWLFGTGLSHWKIFFQQELGFSLSDPHNWLLSIPGTYGLMGVIFYIYIGVLLICIAWKQKGGQRALALILLVLIFVKDLASIPYLIGNTPITLLIWLLIAGTLRGWNANMGSA